MVRVAIPFSSGLYFFIIKIEKITIEKWNKKSQSLFLQGYISSKGVLRAPVKKRRLVAIPFSSGLYFFLNYFGNIGENPLYMVAIPFSSGLYFFKGKKVNEWIYKKQSRNPFFFRVIFLLLYISIAYKISIYKHSILE